jgi:glucose/arabinose dehydrogenase
MKPRLYSIALGSIVCLSAAAAPALARPARVGQIPNGSVRACLNCHVSPESGGPRNAFGQQIEAGFLSAPGPTGTVLWGPTLAGLDADADGLTNGAELQDPTGAWSVGQPQPGDPALVTNPGFAESDTTILAPVELRGGVPLKLALVADGLNAPVEAKVAPGERRRFYVVSQAGAVTAVDRRTGTKTLFVDVNAQLVPVGILGPGSFDERGLLGLAFHPRYRRNGKFYLYMSVPNGPAPSFPTTMPAGTVADHQNVVTEWRANSPGNPAAGATFVKELMRIDWPQFNHNAGDLEFGPDGKLYIATGDGGGSDDQDGDQSINPPPGVVGHPGVGNAQNLSVPLGKILRIDVDGNNAPNGRYGIPSNNPFVGVYGALGEVWAYGLRNPYRMSFDSQSGRLIAGDVGQNDLEEVDVIVKGGNYGWNWKEGTFCFLLNGILPGFASTDCRAGTPPSGLIDPIAQYDTRVEGFSVIGGFVYRGHKWRQLRGKYIFGDYSAHFSFPNGPDNYGRLFYFDGNLGVPGLRTIKEFSNVAEEATRLGLTEPARPPLAFPQTISLMGWAEDDHGNIYALGSRTGRAFDPAGNRRQDGFILRLEPADGPGQGNGEDHDCDD